MRKPEPMAKSGTGIRPAPPPAPPPLRGVDWRAQRRWVRGFASAFLIALAFVAGDLASAFMPEASSAFSRATAGARAALAASLSRDALLGLAVGSVVLLFGILLWRAGQPSKRTCLIIALLLGLGSAAAGLLPVGHELEAERNVAALKERAASLETNLATAQAGAAKAVELEKQLEERNKAAAEAADAAAKQLAAKDEASARQLAAKEQATAQALEAIDRKLKAETARAQEAQAERERMGGVLEKSASAHQAALKERDDQITTLRKELEELKKARAGKQ